MTRTKQVTQRIPIEWTVLECDKRLKCHHLHCPGKLPLLTHSHKLLAVFHVRLSTYMYATLMLCSQRGFWYICSGLSDWHILWMQNILCKFYSPNWSFRDFIIADERNVLAILVLDAIHKLALSPKLMVGRPFFAIPHWRFDIMAQIVHCWRANILIKISLNFVLNQHWNMIFEVSRTKVSSNAQNVSMPKCRYAIDYCIVDPNSNRWS